MDADETRRSRRWLIWMDQLFFVAAGAIAVWLAWLTFQEGVVPGWQLLLLLVFWVLVAYLVLPRLHRILTTIYLPDYFIGRTRTADGLLGDPVNLALRGSEAQVHQAMSLAGWTRADELDLASGWGIVANTLRRRSYPSAPVSPLFLFRRRQDFTYQQEVAGSPSRRHHVRFWRCPEGWLLPGGVAVDWLAAGTYDRSVGLSLFTFQVTHKIDAQVDIERDHIVATVLEAQPAVTHRVIEDFATGYHSRNGGGDVIVTDGDLPILDVSAAAVGAGPPQPDVVASTDRRPFQTAFGVVMTGLRGFILLWLAAIVHAGLLELTDDPADQAVVQLVVAVTIAVLGFADLVLAVATWFGANWSRLVLCALSLWSAATVLGTRLATGETGPMHDALLPLAMTVLVLLALSSAPARLFSTRRRPVRRTESQASTMTMNDPPGV